MKLLVGLGNPGYDNTRHNVGFMAIDKYAELLKLDNWKSKFDGLYQDIIKDNERIILLKPQKYMNLSGEVVRKYVDYFKIDISDILIISDDLDLNLGSFKLKDHGSSGGHNGLKNIEDHLSTQVYKRIKVGISNNKKIDTKDYVLGKFGSDEKDVLLKTLDEVIAVMALFPHKDYSVLMNNYNKKNNN